MLNMILKKKYVVWMVGILLFTIPFIGFAAGLVPCGGLNEPKCDFPQLIVIAQKVINFLIFYLAAPLAAVSFAWAGIMMMTSRGNEQQVTQAKQIFWYVFLGFIISLSAWLIVSMIINALVDKNNFDPSPYIGGSSGPGAPGGVSGGAHGNTVPQDVVKMNFKILSVSALQPMPDEKTYLKTDGAWRYDAIKTKTNLGKLFGPTYEFYSSKEECETARLNDNRESLGECYSTSVDFIANKRINVPTAQNMLKNGGSIAPIPVYDLPDSWMLGAGDSEVPDFYVDAEGEMFFYPVTDSLSDEEREDRLGEIGCGDLAQQASALLALGSIGTPGEYCPFDKVLPTGKAVTLGDIDELRQKFAEKVVDKVNSTEEGKAYTEEYNSYVNDFVGVAAEGAKKYDSEHGTGAFAELPEEQQQKQLKEIAKKYASENPPPEMPKSVTEDEEVRNDIEVIRVIELAFPEMRDGPYGGPIVVDDIEVEATR